MDSKRTFLSDKQKKSLIEIMSSEEELRKGKFSPNFTQKTAQLKWQNIAKDLNAIPGAVKNWVQWKKTWQDLKKQVKRKNSDIRKNVQGTGGGPPSQTLTIDDEAVLNILDVTSVDDDPYVNESEVNIVLCLPDQIHQSEVEVTEGDTSNEGTFQPNKIILDAANPIEKGEVLSLNQSHRKENKLLGMEINTPKKCAQKRTLKSKNLENSISVSQDLVNLSYKKQELKQTYYIKKLKILEHFYSEKLTIEKENLELKKQELELTKDDIIIKQRIATALEELI